MFFLDKIFFAALAGIPLLVLIYFLHRKLRTVQVSSLLLWENQKKSVKSGAGLKRLPLPLTFFIEALILALLAVAATGPFILNDEKIPPLIVILDDSFSMLADNNPSPREAAEKKLLHILDYGPSRPVTLILAGNTPKLLGEGEAGSGRLKPLLEKWRCREVSADIPGALLFARRTFGGKHDILILTDHKPPQSGLAPGISWYSFGRARPNAAIVNAARTGFEGGDKCLIEVVNFSGKDITVPVKLDFSGDNAAEKGLLSELKIPAGQKVKHVFKLPADAGAVKVSIPGDSLEFDNSVVMLPEKKTRIRVDLSGLTPEFKKPVSKALQIVDVAVNSVDPHLLISCREVENPAEDSALWQIIFTRVAKSKAFAGPFTVDRQHPLGSGLQLDGTVWAAGSDVKRGYPVVSAGKTALVSDYTPDGRRHIIYFNFAPSHSTLQNSPNWPVLIYNLIEWRRRTLPGLVKNNFRSGEKVVFNAPPGTSEITLNAPERSVRKIVLNSPEFVIDSLAPGAYQIKAGTEKYDFRINPLAADESDLRHAATVAIDGERTEQVFRSRFVNVAWVFILPALGLAMLHLYLIRRSKT